MCLFAYLFVRKKQSRYLQNKLLLKANNDEVDKARDIDQQTTINLQWGLDHLGDITKDDFI